MGARQTGDHDDSLLGALGIEAQEERAYRWLLTHPGASTEEAAKGLALDLETASHVLDSLETLGFATHSAGRRRRYIPISPNIAVETLARYRQEAIDRARAAIPVLEQDVVRDGAQSKQIIEIITTLEAERHTVYRMAALANEEVMTLTRLPIRVSRLGIEADEDHPEQRQAQARGVRYRTIVDSELLGTPEALTSVRKDIESGEEVRVAPYLPLKMVLADRSSALVPLSMEQVDGPSLLIHASALLYGLRAFFEVLWEQATPICLGENNSVRVPTDLPETPDQAAELVGLLAAGLNDKSIVYELGISRRTLLRRMSSLMDVLGARTRFQAGWIAARGGSRADER